MDARVIWRRSWPWVVGTAIVVLLATRVSLEAFGTAIKQGPHLALAAVNLGVIVVTLAADTVATWAALIAVRVRWSLRDVLAIRGATYVIALLNYAVGQGSFAYYLRNAGVSTPRAVGVTLFMMGTTFAPLLLLTTGAWMMGVDLDANAAMWWTLVGGCGAFAAYLIVIAIAPSFLARRELLAPLFDARLRGYGFAILARAPHVAIIILGHWCAMRAWGIPVPIETGAALMPAVVIVTVLPISPAGLGTSQAALVYFFSDYASGATHEARDAAVLAFALVHYVYGVLAQLIAGLACFPLVKRVQPAQKL